MYRICLSSFTESGSFEKWYGSLKIGTDPLKNGTDPLKNGTNP